MLVLAARCSQLERDFSFGAVRQLFENVAHDPAQRERMLAGAAAPVEGVLDVATAADGAGAEGSFAVLHGLYWAVLNLAEDQPVMLAIDDIQWSDRPSLRFVSYLAHRLEGVPVLVAATLRSTDPGTDAALLAEVAADPVTEPVRPTPLGLASVAELVRSRLGDEPDSRFAAACEEATGGNPLLLRQLLTALAADGVRPTGSGAAAVREIGPRAVSRTVLLRLSRLPAEAAAVAHAVAVLGESSGLPAVAALTGLDEAAVARAVGLLAQADIMRPDPPLGFVHPLVRDAVYGDLPSGERELQHSRAADVLRAAHAPDEEVAAHLVEAPRRGDGQAVELLRGAAREAIRRGGPDSGVAYLNRALEEPPPPEMRAQVLLELGLAESEMSAANAAVRLREAVDGLSDPQARGEAAFALAHSLMFVGEPQEAGELAHRAAAELGPELRDLRQALETVEFISVYFGGADASVLERLEAYREPTDDDNIGTKMLQGSAAFAWAAAAGPAKECEALGLRALAGGGLLATGGGLAWSAAIVSLILSDSPHAAEHLEIAKGEAFRKGSVFGTSSFTLWHGLYLMGIDLEGAGESLETSYGLQDAWGADTTGGSWSRGLVAWHRLSVGDLAAGWQALGEPVPPEDPSDGANLWRRARAELLLAEGRPGEALSLAEDMERLAPWVTHPEWKPALSLKGRALHALGRRDEAIAAIQGELEIARGTGAPSAIGRCLRQLGEIEGDAGLPRLEEAVDVLGQSQARLERARALAALGGALRRGRRPTDAREPLRQALELAEACACPPLVESIRAELRAAGARPRTAALGGVESLTARELSVATMAAEGRTNREIAQALFVTPKTVEVHLSGAYRKLSIRSRRELPVALQAAG
jgi:DNA-binding NarL/FixJ family response regulator